MLTKAQLYRLLHLGKTADLLDSVLHGTLATGVPKAVLS